MYFLLKERTMVDRRRLCAKGGDGGNGCISFHKSRHDRRGKADGEQLCLYKYFIESFKVHIQIKQLY